MASVRQLAVSLAVIAGGLFAPPQRSQPAADEAVLISEIGRLNNQSLLWAHTDPTSILGTRPRIAKSLMTSLMWGRVDSYTEVSGTVRYTCEQNEGMDGYGWEEYDARRGGIQTVHDKGNNLDVTTSFVKSLVVPTAAAGLCESRASHGKGLQAEDVRTMVIFMLSQEDEQGTLQVTNLDDVPLGFDGDVTLRGSSDSLGDYKVVVTKGTGEHPTSEHAYSLERDLEKTVVQSFTAADEHMWQSKPLLMRQLKETVDHVVENYDANQPPPPWQLYQLENRPGSGNVHIVQKIFEGPFEFDVLFSSESAGHDLSSDDLTREIKETSEAFDERFKSTFALQKPYDTAKYQPFARSMFSNLIGGIGYFAGYGIADRSYAPEYDEENEGFWEEAAEARARHKESLDGPHELFTSVPSRPFFPRGFLWDEGFHLLPIADWDLDLALEIVKSWFGLMDDDGWIAREQILGPEARSKVPPEFQVQYPHYANPPTLFFIVNGFVERLRKAASNESASADELGQPPSLSAQDVPLATAYVDSTAAGREYLRQLYPLLRRQFDWFRKTQFGDVKSYDREAFSSREAYRWRGRTEQHVLTSGLDDYPRPQPPHPGELHVDLMAWVGLMTDVLLNTADLLELGVDETAPLQQVREAIGHNVDDLHWSEEQNAYCDATIDEFEENQLVCHKGYISLMPFLVGLLAPDNPKVGRLLTWMGREDEVFSPFGLRSLSKQDAFYGTAEDYWRGPVWMNINYLAVVQLHRVATHEGGPFQKQAAGLYNQLRRNLVDTVYKNWLETGFAWEQYNGDTGKGQRTQHFTGWTSLVVKIMSMPEVGSGSHAKDEL